MSARSFLSLVLAAALLGGCSSDSQSTHVAMEVGHKFTPPTAEGSAGATWTFTNDSDESHTVTLLQDSVPAGADYWASGGFDSEEAARDDVAGGLIKPGEEFEVKIEKAGTYRYFCIPHEGDGMTGTLEVKA